MKKYGLRCILLIFVIAVGWITIQPARFALLAKPWRLFSLFDNSEWRTPIAFYGRVVDESDVPVPNAKIDFSCNDVSVTGTSSYHRTSDTNGVFSILRIKGKLLVVKVTKEGYYTSRADNDAFYYSGQNVNFVPKPAKPEVFHLRKIGIAEPLIYRKMGFRIKKDGTPLEVALTSASAVARGQGDLYVECWTEDPASKTTWKYNWRCHITIPGGGLQQFTNEFPFQAPIAGYVPSDEINMPVTLGDRWGSGAKRHYFMRLANGNYARMTFEMIAGGDHFFEIESLVNPSGSRNLEFDPNKVVQ